MTSQKKATVISSSVAALLTLLKLTVGIASGSVALLASAFDSVLDMFVSLFNYFAINNSERPANKTFNYGRGKIEALASLVEGVIITISGIFLLYQAIKKAILQEVSQYLDVSLMVMIVSLIITILLAVYLNKVAKKTQSVVIKADALHYKTDIYTNLAVLISLILVSLLGIELIDVAVGAGISVFIIYCAYGLIREGVLLLLDRALEDKIVNGIVAIIKGEKRVNTYHMLKTREAGNQIFVEFHLVFDCLITLMDAHKISDKIEDKIEMINPKRHWIINIHMDPYDDLQRDIKNNNF